MNPSHSFLRRRGMLLFIGLTLGVAVLVTVGHHREVNETLTGVQHAHRVLRAGAQLLSALTAAENGQSRYLLTGNGADVAAFREAKALAGLHLETLRQLTRDDPPQQERLNQVAAAAGLHIKEMEGLLSLAAVHGPDSARQVTGRAGKSRMTLLRADLHAFSSVEQARLRERDAQFAAARLTARLLQAGVLGLVVAALYYLFRSLYRQQMARKELFRQIDAQNRTLILDVSPGRRADAEAPIDEKAVVEGLITNLRNATSFVVEIGQGKYEAEFEGLTPENLEANRTTCRAPSCRCANSSGAWPGKTSGATGPPKDWPALRIYCACTAPARKD